MYCMSSLTDTIGLRSPQSAGGTGAEAAGAGLGDEHAGDKTVTQASATNVTDNLKTEPRSILPPARSGRRVAR